MLPNTNDVLVWASHLPDWKRAEDCLNSREAGGTSIIPPTNKKGGGTVPDAMVAARRGGLYGDRIRDFEEQLAAMLLHRPNRRGLAISG